MSIVVYRASWSEIFPQLSLGARRKKKDSKREKRGGLWKLPQLWKKARRCAAFSHSCLDKTERKNVLGFIHNFHRPDGGQ
jgi:hypothetical protein